MRTTILACLLAVAGHLAIAQDRAPTVPVTLKSYATAPDSHYKWEKKDGGEHDVVRWARLHMVSQEWKETTWKHVVWLAFPKEDNWSFEPTSNKVNLKVTVDQQAEFVRGWVARSKTKDFRDAKWSDSPMKGDAGTYTFEAPRDGSYMALFGEVVIDNKPVDAFFSTNLQVFEPVAGN